MTFVEWLEYGRRLGWCREPHCDTHERTPLTQEEEDAFEADDDPCIIVLRLFPPEGIKVEEAS